MTKIKICGITNLKDAQFCVKLGVDLLGFVFFKKSPRFITPKKAGNITARLPSSILKVGVFVNEKPQIVRQTAHEAGLDLLQFHGDESPSYLKQFKDYPTIKAFRIKDTIPFEKIRTYPKALILIDTFSKNLFGGTGKTFNWNALKELKKIKRKVIVSGGLTPENAKNLLDVIEPYALDASSGVEKSPGKKDPRRLKRFMEAVRGGCRDKRPMTK